MNNTPFISVSFKWLSCEADPRPYKPSKPILEPVDVLVEVKVPIEIQYIANAQNILMQQMSGEKVEKPILTPQGMKYCCDQLETAMSPHDIMTNQGDDWDNSVEWNLNEGE